MAFSPGFSLDALPENVPKIHAMTAELAPFIDALQEIASDAGLVLLDAADAAVIRRGVARYNTVSLYLVTRIPDVATVYRPLARDASPGALRMAVRDVMDFVEGLSDADRPGREHGCANRPDSDPEGAGPVQERLPTYFYGGPYMSMRPASRTCARVCA